MSRKFDPAKDEKEPEAVILTLTGERRVELGNGTDVSVPYQLPLPLRIASGHAKVTKKTARSKKKPKKKTSKKTKKKHS
jgi:hypothetical protein